MPPKRGRSPTSSESSIEIELTNKEALQKLKVADLLALARKLKVPELKTLTTKLKLVEAISKLERGEVKSDPKAKANPDLDLLLELLVPYCGKLDCPARLTWANPKGFRCVLRCGRPCSGANLRMSQRSLELLGNKDL